MRKVLFYTSLLRNVEKKNKPSVMSFTCGPLTRLKSKRGEHPSSTGSETDTQSPFVALNSWSDSILFMGFPFSLFIAYEFIANPLSMLYVHMVCYLVTLLPKYGPIYIHYTNVWSYFSLFVLSYMRDYVTCRQVS